MPLIPLVECDICEVPVAELANSAKNMVLVESKFCPAEVLIQLGLHFLFSRSNLTDEIGMQILIATCAS